MENVSDWLYIVLLAVAGISSIFSAARKRRKQQEEAANPTQQSWDFPTEADTYNDAFPFPQQQAAPVVRRSAKRKPAVSPAASHPAAASSIQDVKAEAPLVSPDDFNNAETLRKAFIYSEILQRKY